MAGKRKQPPTVAKGAATPAAAATTADTEPPEDNEEDEAAAVVDKLKPSSSLSSLNKKSSHSSVTRRDDDHVEFPLSNLHPHLTCPLCQGYYRDAHTIVDCLHSFCKSCLILFFEQKLRQRQADEKLKKNKGYYTTSPHLCCPTCDMEVGPHPFRKHTSISTVQILPDRTLQEIVDKLFPQFKAKELEEEKEFYNERNIQLKSEFRLLENSNGGNDANTNHDGMKDQVAAFMNDTLIELRLQPDCNDTLSSTKASTTTKILLPTLKNQYLRTSGKLKIVSLKKYILKHLDIMNQGGGGGGGGEEEKANTTITKSKSIKLQSVEILCNGFPMGNELNLTFIHRTIWSVTKPDEMMTLTYRMGT
jgi:hypothetical protein